jgi:hypothetical protein
VGVARSAGDYPVLVESGRCEVDALQARTLVLPEANRTMIFFSLSDRTQFVDSETARAPNAFMRMLHPNGATEAPA